MTSLHTCGEVCYNLLLPIPTAYVYSVYRPVISNQFSPHALHACPLPSY